MLLSVATHYGKSSVEYGMVGGVPKNQCRKGLRGESSTPSSEEQPFVTIADSKSGKNSAAIS
jgi:hypothetical protein